MVRKFGPRRTGPLITEEYVMSKLTKESINQLLAENDKAVARALVVLHNRQVADEQAHHLTKYNNGVGFTPADAYMGTSMATFYQKRGFLSPKQIGYWRKRGKNGTMRIGKYWRQLIDAAEEKQGE